MNSLTKKIVMPNAGHYHFLATKLFQTAKILSNRSSLAKLSVPLRAAFPFPYQNSIVTPIRRLSSTYHFSARSYPSIVSTLNFFGTKRSQNLNRTLMNDMHSNHYRFHSSNDNSTRFSMEPSVAIRYLLGTFALGVFFRHVLDPHKKETHQEQITDKNTVTDAEPPLQEAQEKPSIPTLNFKDIGGYDEIKENLRDVIKYSRNPQAFKKLGVKPPKGILLIGSPGVGKTRFVEALAGEANIPLVYISGGSLHQKYVGETEQLLRDKFKYAKSIGLCIIHIDEIDAVGSSRTFGANTSSSTKSDNAILAQLLTLLEQYNGDVIVIASTNHYEALDPALVRPGRFDRHIKMTLPNQDERSDILRVCLKAKNMDKSISYQDLARLSAGFSGAMLNTWVNEASLLAIKNGSQTITDHHFDQSRGVVTGISIRRINYDEAQKAKAALHAAGQALIGHLLGRKIYKVDIGRTQFIEDDTSLQIISQNQLQDIICTALAGRAAEELFLKIKTTNNISDFETAKKMAKTLINSGMGSTLSGLNLEEDIERCLKEQMERARRLLSEHQDAHLKLTQEIKKRNSLNNKEFNEVVGTSLFGAQTSMGHETENDQPKSNRFTP